jgi:hypothetical protein
MRMKLVVVALMTFSVLGAGAQMDKAKTSSGTAATGIAAAGKADPAKAADKLLSSFEKDFMAAARAMPADKYDFTPDSLHVSGANFATVRTFAQEVTHVTMENYSIFAGVTGTKPTVDVKAIGKLKSKEEIVTALADSFAVAHTAISTITPANQNDPAGNGLTKEALAIYGALQGYDHYGQMVEYLRMNGIVPNASAPKKK